MKLSNGFSDKTRLLWLYHHSCASCGTNGNGMLELHHITGRDSSATVNGVVVCTECHSHFGHSDDEEKYLFAKNLATLRTMRYEITADDETFMREHPHLITNNTYLEEYGI